MILTKEEEEFIKNNQEMLERIFRKRIDELKDNVFSPVFDQKDRDVEIRFVQEYQSWLRTINIIKDNNKGQFNLNKIYE